MNPSPALREIVEHLHRRCPFFLLPGDTPDVVLVETRGRPLSIRVVPQDDGAVYQLTEPEGEVTTFQTCEELVSRISELHPRRHLDFDEPPMRLHEHLVEYLRFAIAGPRTGLSTTSILFVAACSLILVLTVTIVTTVTTLSIGQVVLLALVTHVVLTIALYSVQVVMDNREAAKMRADGEVRERNYEAILAGA